MNKQRKTSHILNVFQYDADGHVILPATLTIGENPHSSDNTNKIPSTAWVRTYVSGLSYQGAITLTNTGSSGAATLLSNTLNIPTYTLAGLGGEPAITAGTTAQYWRGDKSFQTLNTTVVTEGTNLYYTDARVGSYLTANNYATQSYVGTQIANLVDAAPGTLDTLNELAAALGDDPNFATTIATSIGTKQAQLNGTGFVKVSGTTVSYDNSTYLTTSSAASTYVSLSGSYANPAWITSLAYSKITGVPAFLTSYTETDTLASVTGRGSSTTTAITISSSTDQLITLNATDSSWTYLGFSWAGTRRGYFGLNASGELNIGSDYGQTFRVSGGGGMTVDGSTVLHGGTNTIPQNITLNTNADNWMWLWQSSSSNSWYIGPTTSNFGIGGNLLAISSSGSSPNSELVLERGTTRLLEVLQANLKYKGNIVWHQGNLTNLNQLTNGPGYITGYTETDTLASVTARGASTSTRTTFTEVGATREGSDTVAVGPWFRWTNVAESRQMLTQLNASNGLTWWSYNGSVWASRMTLHQGGQLVLNNGVSNGSGEALIIGGSGDVKLSDGGSIFFGAYDYAASTYIRGYDDSNLMRFYINGTNSVTFTSSGISASAISVGSSAVWHAGNFTPGNYLPLSGGELSGPTYKGTIASGVYTTHWKDGSGSYQEAIGNSTATRKLRLQSYNGSSAYAQWFMDGGNMQIYGDVAGNRNFLIDSTTAYIRHNGADKLWGGSDGTRNSGWAYHNNNNSGLHWPNNGWHFYPKDASDIYVRSGASDCSIHMVRNGTSGNYIHCSSASDIGFLSTSRSWTFRVENGGNAQVYGYLGVGQAPNTSYRVITSGDYYANAGGNYWAEGRFKQYRGSGTWHDVIDSGNIGSQSVNYASYAGYLPTLYAGGVQSNPQTYFNNGVGLRVAMTGHWSVWSDTLWINGYSGGDVLQMCALHTLRNGTPRMAISVQASTSTSYGTIYEFLTTYNAGYAYNMNQNVRTSDGPTFADVYVTGWFRNHTNSNGIYWSATGWHLMPYDGADFRMHSGSSGAVALRMETNGTVRGYVYANSSNEIGFLNSGRSWTFRVENGGRIVAHGPIARTSHSNGFLEGSYNSVGGNSYYTNPIYTIGSSYNPTDSSLQSMYGIGYSHPNFWGGGKTPSWGLYVCEGGTINATIGGGSTTIWAQNDIVAYSDARVKDNIEVVENAVEKIKAIRGVTFTRTDANDKDRAKRHAGVIAQEVLKVLPEVVSGTEEDMYSVAYGNMAALFIEAIKEQQKQIEELQNKLDNVLSSR